MWQKVKAVIRDNQSFLLSSHIFPDGDAIASELAMAHVLRAAGKKVLIVNEHPTPVIYHFLDPRGAIKVYTDKLRKRAAKCDAAIVLDVGSLERCGRVGAVIAETGMRAVCIDHHKTNTGFANVNVVEKSAAATGELVYSLAKSMETPITRKLAAILFTAVSTDTGWFRFPNTSAHTLRVAAGLVEKGANPDKIYQAVNETMEWQRLELMKLVLDTLDRACDGRIATLCITEEMLRETGAKHEDAEDFVDIPRALRGVEMIILFRETDKGIKVSLRSKSGPAVEQIAKKHGGGGHAKAAGTIIRASMSQAKKLILADAKRLVEHGSL